MAKALIAAALIEKHGLSAFTTSSGTPNQTTLDRINAFVNLLGED